MSKRTKKMLARQKHMAQENKKRECLTQVTAENRLLHERVALLEQQNTMLRSALKTEDDHERA